MTTLRHLSLLLVATLAACSTQTTRPPEIAVPPTAKPAKPAPPTENADTSPAPTPPLSKPPAPAKSEGAAKKPTPSQAAAPAVMALLHEAEASTAAGSLDEAAATLERAIRLQPRNAELWHQLAKIRLQQHQPGLAEDLAKKSNVLAQDNPALARKNWALIAEARRQKGDAPGAADAEAKAK